VRKYILTTALASLLLTACNSKVPAGHVGVIVNLYGEDKGVSEKVVGVGKYYIGPYTDLFLFPTFLQNYTWSNPITMQTSEGLTIGANMGITYFIKPENVVKVFQKYRLGIDEITDSFLRNMVRDAVNHTASTYTVEELYSVKKRTIY
jgi:hypothetical protein